MLGPPRPREERGTLPAWALTAWNCFHDLCSSRAYVSESRMIGEALLVIALPQRIGFQAINDYGWRYGIEGEAFDELKIFVRALDDEYLAVMAEQRGETAPRGDGYDDA